MNRSKHPRSAALPVLLAGLCAALGLPATSIAATATSTFSVTATVVPTCLVSASTVAFGTYSGPQIDATGSVSVTCTNLAAYTVELDAGTGASATTAARKMTGPSSATLTYNLYADAARTVVWGTLAALQAAAGVGSGSAQSLTVYGRVVGSQVPTAGSYSDTITVTVNY